MATQGTIAAGFDQYRNFVAKITGIVATGTTPIMRSQGFVIGSFQLTGFTASGLTATLIGSNDGVNFYEPLANAIGGSDGLYGLISQNSTSVNAVPLYFAWTIGGTFTSGSGTIIAVLMSTFG